MTARTRSGRVARMASMRDRSEGLRAAVISLEATTTCHTRPLASLCRRTTSLYPHTRLPRWKREYNGSPRMKVRSFTFRTFILSDVSSPSSSPVQ